MRFTNISKLNDHGKKILFLERLQKEFRRSVILYGKSIKNIFKLFVVCKMD